jgi:hypothetical protein
MSVKLTIEFPNEAYREEFIAWFSNSGEQDFDMQITEYNSDGPTLPLYFDYPSEDTITTEIIEQE